MRIPTSGPFLASGGAFRRGMNRVGQLPESCIALRTAAVLSVQCKLNELAHPVPWSRFADAN